MTSAWLLAWSVGVVLFLLPIGTIIIASSVLSLRRAGIRRPGLVVLKRAFRLLPLRSRQLPVCGATAVLVWGLRWMYDGQTNARVVAVDEVSGKLDLELELPIPILDAHGYQRGGVQHVEFLPSAGRQAPYRWLSVTGTLRPCIGEVAPTAEIVVYQGFGGTHK